MDVMKKIYLLLASISVISLAYASPEGETSVVDLDGGSYMCNGKPINYETDEATIQGNCKDYKLRKQRTSTSTKNLDDENHVTSLSRVHFTTDDGTKLQCYYRNKKLSKCKLAQGRG